MEDVPSIPGDGNLGMGPIQVALLFQALNVPGQSSQTNLQQQRKSTDGWHPC